MINLFQHANKNAYNQVGVTANAGYHFAFSTTHSFLIIIITTLSFALGRAML